MKFLWSSLLLICLLSCKAQSLYGEKMEDLILIAQDGYSGISEYETSVIKDKKSLNKFYAQINKTRKPGLPAPTVDFSKEMLLVVCLGEIQGQRDPMLSQIEQTDDVLSIAVELSTIKKSTENSQVISYPFYVYKMPLVSKEISFKKIGW